MMVANSMWVRVIIVVIVNEQASVNEHTHGSN